MESVAAETSLLVGLPLVNAVAFSTSAPASDVMGSGAIVESAADSSLLLVDLALAELDADDDSQPDESVWCNNDADDRSASDMALAAVLDDEAAWWGGL